MPRKKIQKDKDRKYLDSLLEKAGLSDKLLVESVVNGLRSKDSTERSKARDVAFKLKGFAEIDKKEGDALERLPISNITAEELDKMANRCAYCKHGKFEPLRKNAELAGVPKLPPLPPSMPPEPKAKKEPEEGEDD